MKSALTTMLLVCVAGACAARQAPTPPNAPAAPKPKQARTPPDKGVVKPSPDAPPPAANPAAGNAAADAPTVPKSLLPPPSALYTELGYGDWGLSGSESKFRQYATIPHGFFIKDLRYSPFEKSPSETAFFDLKGIGSDDYRAETRLVWSYGETQVSGFLSRFNFSDPLPNPVAPSSRQVDGFNVKQSLSRDFALAFRYRDDTQHNNYEVPYSNLNQNTQYLDAIASGKIGSGFASANYSNLHYSDRTGTLPGAVTQTTGLKYLWTPSDALDIEAAFAHVGISQTGLPQSRVDTLSLNGDFALNSMTDLNVRFQQRSLGMPTVQSAYVRAQGLGTVSLFHRWKSWRGQIGFRLQDDERVNGDQTFVDVPKWSTVEGRLSGRLLPDWRLTVRGYTQSLDNPPSAITQDPGSLYWNNRDFVEARLEGGPPDVNYYLVYTYRADHNSVRQVEVQTTQFTLGSVWQISPTLSLFGEFHHESWSGQTGLDASPTLSDFLPNSTTGIVELTWARRRLFFSVSYTGFTESNNNPLLLPDGNGRGSFLTLSGRYQFPRDYELGLSVAPWSYHDSVVGALDYNAAVVMVTGSARF